MIELMQPLSEPVTIRPIRSQVDYECALAEIDELMGNVQPGTSEYERLDILARLVEDYEGERYPMGRPDPIAMIEFVMAARGLTRKDLEAYIGPRQRYGNYGKAPTPDPADGSPVGTPLGHPR